MNIEKLEELINEHLDMITITTKSILDAKERSGKFLIIQSILATFLRDFEEDRSKVKTLELTSYAISLGASEGKNITEKKVNVELDRAYSQNREDLEKMDAIREYLKTHIKIFENAHLMYRQYSRE